MEGRDARTAWRRVALVAGVLFLSNVLPAKRRDPPQPPPYGIDKVLHAAGHAALAVVLRDALERTDRSPIASVVFAPSAVAALLSTLSGLVLELLQRWIPGRRYESGDVLSAAVGSALGVGIQSWRATVVAPERRVDDSRPE
ncbi:VanZ family protein [Salinigranum sp. GCM10025319]|uniref:VanZ family protein n=1 Tax=Salinigranum sp. GCM10025319 TaxID=3252687 RepID=UPI0036091408